MINIRKLAAVDMAIHGARFIVAEYAIGVILPLILGVVPIRSIFFGVVYAGWEIVLVFWLLGASANYIPLLIYAILIARGGTIKEEGQPELARVKRYNVQQVIILVPFLVAVLALVQENHQQ